MSMFVKAVRKKAKLRMALTGVSGSGKTLGALYIAYGMTKNWGKIAVLDTEHDRALFYANREDLGTGEFLHCTMTPPYSPERYKALVADAASVVGTEGVVIVDSFSHAWSNEGGVLELKDKIASRPGKTSYTAWAEAGKAQNNLVNTILASDCHVIVTLRSKMEYALEENERGKQVPVKLGLAPVQRDDTEYEFDIVLNIDRAHTATASKDTTFLDGYGEIITPALGEKLAAWLDEGEAPEICEECGKAIRATEKNSVESIIEGTKKNTGKQMCMACYKKWYDEHKPQQTKAETALAAAREKAEEVQKIIHQICAGDDAMAKDMWEKQYAQDAGDIVKMNAALIELTEKLERMNALDA